MKVNYDAKKDLLYIRMDDAKQELINKRVDEDFTLDVGEGGKIIGMEILNASKNLDLGKILPIEYSLST